MEAFRVAHLNGVTDEALAALGRVRDNAREARGLVPELVALGAQVRTPEIDLDARLLAVDLSIDRYLSLAAGGQVDEGLSTRIGEHIAYVAAVAGPLSRKRDADVASGRITRDP